MRHNKVGRQLGRNASHRDAMYRNMVTSLFEHGRIETTDAKAKELRKIAEKLITMGRDNNLAARRRALGYVKSRKVVTKLFDEISPGFGARPGGYTRIVKVGNRRGDNAPISILELVTEEYKPSAQKKKSPAKAAPAKKAAATPAPASEPATEAPAE